MTQDLGILYAKCILKNSLKYSFIIETYKKYLIEKFFITEETPSILFKISKYTYFSL